MVCEGGNGVIGLKARGAGSYLAVVPSAIVGLFIIAAACTVLMPRHASALSLDLELNLPRAITQPIKQLLEVNGSRTQPQQPDNPPVTQPNKASSPEPAANSPSSNSSTDYLLDVEPLPRVPRLYINLGTSQFLGDNQEPNNDQAVLGSSTLISPISNVAILHKSGHGWVLLGTPWYVWLACMAALVFGLHLGYRYLIPAIAGVNSSTSINKK